MFRRVRYQQSPFLDSDTNKIIMLSFGEKNNIEHIKLENRCTNPSSQKPGILVAHQLATLFSSKAAAKP